MVFTFILSANEQRSQIVKNVIYINMVQKYTFFSRKN